MDVMENEGRKCCICRMTGHSQKNALIPNISKNSKFEKGEYVASQSCDIGVGRKSKL